ncbi:hypothetical protein ACOME3_003131 [Neoechinorhynchus agilis]
MLLENLPPHCLIHGFDCSSKALNAFRQNPNFDQSRCQLSLVDLCDRNDMTARRCELLRDCADGFDFAVSIFTLSAIGPMHLRLALEFIWSLTIVVFSYAHTQ